MIKIEPGHESICLMAQGRFAQKPVPPRTIRLGRVAQNFERDCSLGRLAQN